LCYRRSRRYDGGERNPALAWRSTPMGPFMLKYEGVLHFTIPVKDLDRSEKFYTEILGFEKVGRTDRIVFLRAGDDFFNLTISENPITTNAGDRHEIHSAFRLTPQAYDEALKMLPSQGIAIFKQEHRRAGIFVGRSAYIRDPDSNVIEFIDLVRVPARQA
jgi:catechol 2,3-dioxygenase-like lactoylglutathione lyase family enzyme